MSLRGAVVGLVLVLMAFDRAGGSEYALAPFNADVTIPIGHRCMGILETKAKRIVDPLLVRGFVLTGPEQPLVLVAVDWCEIRNDAYRRWREVLAEAAGTIPQRVLVSSVHQHDAPVVDLGAEALQMYVSGCSGDITAGKYNDGSPGNRPRLARRLYRAMEAAWLQSQSERQPLKQVAFRSTPLLLDFHAGATFTSTALRKQLANDSVSLKNRILAAMGLASRSRLDRPIDFSCIDFGPAQIVLFPGESFVGYQLMAQQLRPDSFVLSIGYGECWPGYIPTRAAFADHFGSSWRWVAPGAETRMRAALQRVLIEPPVHDIEP